MVHIATLHELGWRFLVHSTGFCVHRWHAQTVASYDYKHSKHDGKVIRKHMEGLWTQVR